MRYTTVFLTIFLITLLLAGVFSLLILGAESIPGGIMGVLAISAFLTLAYKLSR